MRRAVALLFVAACVACGGPDRVHVIAPDDLPPGLFASPTPRPTAEPGRPVRVWFVRGTRLHPVVRSAAAGEAVPDFLARSLLAGPTAAERAAGVSTSIPADAEVLGVAVAGDVASVNLSREFELSAELGVLVRRLGQVVYTLTEVPGVDRVRFRIDGEPELVVGEDGRARGSVSRRDYARIAPPIASPEPTPGGVA